jgi:hypothetical protein
MTTVGYVIFDLRKNKLFKTQLYRTIGHAKNAMSLSYPIKGFRIIKGKREDWDYREFYKVLPAKVDYDT